MGKRSFKRLLCAVLLSGWGALSLSGVEIEPDNRKIDPLARATDAPAVRGAQREILRDAPKSDILFPVLVRLSRPADALPGKMRRLGATARGIHALLYTARIPWDSIRYVSNWEEVAYIEAAKIARPLLDLSRSAVLAHVVHAGTPSFPPPFDGTGLTGRDTYIGIVDTGLSQDHLDFFADGNPGDPRVAGWFPSQVTAGVDSEWHGTHVTGIAAGNGFLSGGLYTGMAPDARLLIHKSTFFTDVILNEIDTLLSRARADNLPIAVNLSLGVSTGSHDGTSLFEEGVNALATNPPGSRQVIAAAAGNERDQAEHFRSTLPPFGPVTAALTLFPPSLSNGTAAMVDLWAHGDDRYTVTASRGSETVTVASGAEGSSPGRAITVSNATDTPTNGGTHVVVFFTHPAVSTGASIVLQRTRNGGDGRIDAYIDILDGHFDDPEEGGTITEPANAADVVAVGSFNTKTFDLATGGSSPAPMDISSFSSLGPTRDGRTKPDVVAPGSVIFSTKSRDPFGGDADDPPPSVPGNESYAVMQGTSMAAPHVAGIAALVWESNPALTGAQMRERLRRTADNVLVDGQSPNNTWGHGKVNALRAVTESVASIAGPGTAAPGSFVTLTSGDSSGSFGNPLSAYSWSLAAPAGSDASLSGTSTPSASFTPDIPGIYTVSLNVSQSDPANTPAGSADAIIRVNNVPVAVISGPVASDNVSAPATFSGVGSSDDDEQELTYRWVLVSRPTGSSAALSRTTTPNVTLLPDVAGAYDIGLRVDDGLDDSKLFVHRFTAGAVAVGSPGGSGGGCSVTDVGRNGDLASAAAAFLLFVLPVAAVGTRSRFTTASHRGT